MEPGEDEYEGNGESLSEEDAPGLAEPAGQGRSASHAEEGGHLPPRYRGPDGRVSQVEFVLEEKVEPWNGQAGPEADEEARQDEFDPEAWRDPIARGVAEFAGFPRRHRPVPKPGKREAGREHEESRDDEGAAIAEYLVTALSGDQILQSSAEQ